MEKDEIFIGSHVGMGSPNYFLGSVEEALSYGANTFMFYTGAPQNSFRKPLDELKIKEGLELIKKNGLNQNKIIVHAPYIINAANTLNPAIEELAIKTILNELKRTFAFGVKIMVLHPGAHVGAGKEAGINALVHALNYVFEQDKSDVKIALETMSGKGSEIGSSFDDISTIISNCKYKDRLGVCLDTCHINDAGYDLKDIDSVLNEFDKKIGLNKLLVIHINDSKNVIGSHKDRHENIGYGTIGFDIINQICHHPLLKEIPKILETPYFNKKAVYKKEIEMLRNSSYENNWREKIEG